MQRAVSSIGIGDCVFAPVGLTIRKYQVWALNVAELAIKLMELNGIIRPNEDEKCRCL